MTSYNVGRLRKIIFNQSVIMAGLLVMLIELVAEECIFFCTGPVCTEQSSCIMMK